MEDKLVPVSNDDFDYSEPSVLVVQRKKGRKPKKSKSKKVALLIISVIFVSIALFKLLPLLQKKFDSSLHADNVNSFVTDTSIDTQSTEDTVDDTVTDNASKDEMPKDNYQIITNIPTNTTFINESNSTIKVDNLQHKKLSIEDVYQSYGNDAPIVLITHFSPTEAYSNGKYYSKNDSFYSDTKNVTEIGERLCQILNSNGINAKHVSECINQNSLYNSRQEYEASLSKILFDNPSIQYVFDISRDVKINYDFTMSKSCTIINDVAIPTIQIITGSCDSFLSINQRENLSFALSLSKYTNEKYPNLVISNIVSKYELSQNYTPICLRIDIGAYSNTYEEALCSAQLFAESLCSYIKNPIV